MSKSCSKCGETKPFSEFYKHRNGVQTYCKCCAKAEVSAWKKANVDKVRSYESSYRPVWRENNPDKVKAAYSGWKSRNPEKVRLSNQNRRAKKIASGNLSNGLSERLYKLQKGLCACCKQPLGDDYHLDHILPLALGGTNTDDNIQLLRAECNMQKSAKHPIEFMQQRGFLL